MKDGATQKRCRGRIGVRDIALIGVMTAVIEVSKLALTALPNVELVTFWIIMFTLFFGPKTVYSILVFILIEISMYGIHTWIVMYLYIWPALALLTCLFKKADSVWIYSMLSGFFGLFFGAFCAIPYFFIGMVDGGIRSGLIMAFNWWIAGIPWDIVHGLSNFVLMLTLYVPIRQLLRKVKRKGGFLS